MMTEPNSQSPLYGNCGVPVVRDGDKVFFINGSNPFGPWKKDLAAMQKQMTLLMLSGDNYRCPFDFINEHRQWFEWHKLLHFDKQTTGKIITSMLSDVARIKAHKIERELTFRFTGRCDFMPRLSRPSVIVSATT